ncbi:MAG: protein tyrosine phosphatase family protein [Cyanobacteria bacterium J06626_4]
MLNDVYHYLPISNHLATAGQPTADQFATIRQAGFDIVVNLALPTSTHALPDERSVVEACGMTYVPIPVMWAAPTAEDFEQFQATLASQPNHKIFVHCAMNMRVSAFVYLHQRLEGIPPSVAAANLVKIWAPNETWQQFITVTLASAGDI